MVGLQPFYVLHAASAPSNPVKRASAGVGARRKIDLSSQLLHPAWKGRSRSTMSSSEGGRLRMSGPIWRLLSGC